MSLLKVDPLPPVQYFSIVPSTSVEDALIISARINHSISDLLIMHSQSDGEFSNLYALEFSARLAAELIDASVSALQKSRKEGGAA